MDTDIIIAVDADTLFELDPCAAMTGAFGRNPSLVAAASLLTPMWDTSMRGVVSVIPDLRAHSHFHPTFCMDACEQLAAVSGARR
jgi:hypothetical protein